jgi:mannose-1-phosphate guanylyltransferase
MSQPDIRVVIMAGGGGTRFWPLSRQKRPKQFLPIVSSKTMLQETVDRLEPFIPLSRIHTVANAEQTETVRRLIPRLPAANCLVEPQAKNTAASLLLATAYFFNQNPKAAVIVLPSDHLIGDVPVFLKQLEAGAEAACALEALVTFGIRPSFPATGYGYIHFAEKESATFGGFSFFDVLEFKEKPALKQAQEFLAAGNYWWNSGMFVWKAETFAAKLKRHAPEFWPFWERTTAALRAGDRREVEAFFKEAPSLSIDFALMEKARGVVVCPADFRWSDVGAWSALLEVWPKDAQGSASRGELLSLDSGNCLVYSPGKLTALVGVHDLIVVETEDALLVCRRDQDQKVKDILERLKKDGRTGLI